MSRIDETRKVKLIEEFHGKTRMVHLFSATLSQKIRDMAKRMLFDEVFVSIGEPGSGKKDIL